MATTSLSETAPRNETKILADNGTALKQTNDNEIISTDISVQRRTKSERTEKQSPASESSSEMTQHLAEVEHQDSVAFPRQFNFLIALLKIAFTTLILVLPVLLWLVFATLRFVFEELEAACANVASTKEFLQTYTIKEDQKTDGVEQDAERHFEKDNFELKAEVQRLQNENTDLNTRLHHLEEDNIEKTTEVKRFQDDNSSFIITMKRQEKENSEIYVEKQRLENENTDLTTKLRHLEEDNLGLTTEVKRLQDENSHLTTKILRLEEENDQIKVENSDLKEINNLLQQDSSSAEKISLKPLVDFQLQGLEFFERTKKLQQEICGLKNQNLEIRQETKNQIQQLREEDSKKNNEILQHEKEKQQLREEKNSMESQIQQLREENIGKNNEIQQHVDDNRRKGNEIRQLYQEKLLIEKEKQQLQEEKSSVESQMEKQIQQLRQEKNDIDHVNLELQEANREKDNVIQIHEENNRRLSNEIGRIQRKKDAKSGKSMKNEIDENTSSIFTECGTVTFSTDDKLLGRGGWAAVYTGDFYGTKVAVKEYHEIILSPHNLKILKREINIASQCRHPNLLQMICATKNEKNRLLIVTELMDMTLRALLEQRANENSRLEPSQVKSISLDVAQGLNYLHLKTPNPIIHRDVSSANVLLWIENDSVRRAKISDYGSANFMQACNTANPGAALYAAPEARGAQHSPKIDVFSYGLLVCEMCNGELPLPDQAERKKQIEKITDATVRGLVEACTREDPQKRPAMEDLIDFWKRI